MRVLRRKHGSELSIAALEAGEMNAKQGRRTSLTTIYCSKILVLFMTTNSDRCSFTINTVIPTSVFYITVSQPPGAGINYSGPRVVLLEFVILVF
jgi:hypothetical protein